MIRQTELRAVIDEQRRLADLAAVPVVAEYLAGAEALKKRVSGLRDRQVAGESVEPGACRTELKSTAVVSYEKFFAQLREIEEIALELLANPEAKALMKQLREKDPEASFITSRRAFDVILGDG